MIKLNDTYQEISQILEQEHIKYDTRKLEEVCEFCEKNYKNLVKNNEDMLKHVIGVAKNVAILRLDDTSIYASLLHGMVKCEDFDKTKFNELFGSEIYDMIITIDKLSFFNIKNKVKLDNENLRNMFLAMAKDIRTVIIRLVDRLYNMQNIDNVLSEETKILMAKECITVYAPIAHRLGMSQIKSELEDISFRILLFEEYDNIKKQIDEKRKQREDYIKDRIIELENDLKKEGIEASVYGRPKHFYSIYKKVKERNCRIDDLFDLLAIRIIVNSVKDCYNILGIVHDRYKPMPNRFKDYIAVPKTNMYQSLHTTVFGEDSRPFEIQIRTWDMHKVADYGIAAHFSYKEKTNKITDADKKIIWLRQTLEIQKQLIDTTENMQKIKLELFGEEVFVFTPKGDVKALPKGSTGIDFAYLIHQKIAEQMIGVKINSKLVPLNTKLENTDVVEIVTSTKSKGPSRDWIKMVSTTNAKSKITAYLKKINKAEYIQKGREEFERILKRQRISKELLLKDEYVKSMLKSLSQATLEDLYENIGFHSILPRKAVNYLVAKYNVENSKSEVTDTKNKLSKVTNRDMAESLIVVENIKHCKVKFAKCCLPIPGDEIVGYITNSNGVTIHRTDCPNLINLNTNLRGIKVSWKEKIKEDFIVKLNIRANSRQNLITEVIGVFNELKLKLTQINSRVTDDKEIIIEVYINMNDVTILPNIIRNVKKVDSVFEVKRVR